MTEYEKNDTLVSVIEKMDAKITKQETMISRFRMGFLIIGILQGFILGMTLYEMITITVQ